jgi:tetratricopeptide (TPR) repeat protein
VNRGDERECPCSGATAAAGQAYQRALSAFKSWHGGADEQLAVALLAAPAFVMGHVLRAYMFVGSRDPRRIRLAHPLLVRAAALRTNARERLHLAAIGAAVTGDYERATAWLDELLSLYPRDALALQVASTFDYFMGESARMLDRVEAVLPAWSSELPGYHAVLATHAFALVECAEYERAECAAQVALDLNALDIRAHHVMAHVFEMTDRADAGMRWMTERIDSLGVDRLFTTHCWWHLALFHLTQGRADRALSLYDDFVRADHCGDIADLIDAAALLWRVRLRGVDIGARGVELAAAWAPHIDDSFCTFNDLHAMLAFVAACDWERAQRLEAVLVASCAGQTRHSETSRQLGLPACRALIAFGRGDNTLAITLLASLPALAHRLGGSHAQRDVLHLTLLQAVERIRKPVRSRESNMRRSHRPVRPSATGPHGTLAALPGEGHVRAEPSTSGSDAIAATAQGMRSSLMRS